MCKIYGVALSFGKGLKEPEWLLKSTINMYKDSMLDQIRSLNLSNSVAIVLYRPLDKTITHMLNRVCAEMIRFGLNSD